MQGVESGNPKTRPAENKLCADSGDFLAKDQKDDFKQPRRKRTKRSKCDMCQRKVEFMLMSCRCGSVFCMEHRLPEAHSCKYDFKTQGKEMIKAANPLVAAPKVDKF